LQVELHRKAIKANYFIYKFGQAVVFVLTWFIIYISAFPDTPVKLTTNVKSGELKLK
jgi:hypothetical protein